jgi:hypothetical protein
MVRLNVVRRRARTAYSVRQEISPVSAPGALQMPTSAAEEGRDSRRLFALGEMGANY